MDDAERIAMLEASSLSELFGKRRYFSSRSAQRKQTTKFDQKTKTSFNEIFSFVFSLGEELLKRIRERHAKSAKNPTEDLSSSGQILVSAV